MKTEPLDPKFARLYEIFTRPAFLSMESLGGEIPFYITTYHPAQQIEADQQIRALKNRLETGGIGVLEIQLYHLCLDILRERGILDKLLEKEPEMTRERFSKSLQAPLDVERNLIPAIAERYRAADCRLVFLTGVGLVFPYIRSHTVLNNLQSVLKEVPTILFFPGVYSGTSLELFGRLKDDNYYRAFSLDHYKG